MAVIDFEDTKGNFALKFSQFVMSLCRTGFTAKGMSCDVQAVKPWHSFWQKLLPLRSFLIPADNVLRSTVAGVSRTAGNIGENRNDSGVSSLLPRRLPLNLPILYARRL